MVSSRSPRSPRARRTQAERSSATQQDILRATIVVVHRKGIENTSVFEIAKEAGLTPGAIQHHFPSKSALLMRAATELVHADDEHGARRIWPEPGAPLEERAHRAMRGAWEGLYSQPRYLVMWSIFMGMRSDTELLAHLAAEREKLHQRTYALFIESFPELRSTCGSVGIADTIFSALRGMAMLRVFENGDAAIDAQLAVLADMLVTRCKAV